VPGAQRPDVEDQVSHGLQDGRDPFDDFRGAAGHDREGAVARLGDGA